MNVGEAFEKFQHRLEITKSEEDDAARRHREVRDYLATKLDVTEDFLTGSYKRDTKTKPLRDVDVFVVLADVTEADDPNDVLRQVFDALVEKYGQDRVATDRPAVRVDFPRAGGGSEPGVMGVEVVPAIKEATHHSIAAPSQSGWMATDPKIHAELATEANRPFSSHWKPLVKMVKAWNRHHGEPIVPSFLIEVMALKLVRGDWTGAYPREVRAFFASAAEQVDYVWADPAGLGSPVSDHLHSNLTVMDQARVALRDAERLCGEAIRKEASVGSGAANEVWQAIFGPLFAKT